MNHLAVISDVHGNLQALETVLADIKQRGIDLIYNLGDLVGKGPASAEALDLCRQTCAVTVRGNWDSGIATEKDSPVAAWYQAQLGEARLEYLRDLANSYDFRLSGKQVRLFHASAVSENYRVHADSGQEKLEGMFQNTPFTGMDAPLPDIALYGDIHAAYLRYVEIGDVTKTLINVGSVGNPLDMPLASYVILNGVLGGDAPAPFSIEFVRLPYDIEATLEQARQRELPDIALYEKELRTAVYQRRRRD